MSPCPRVSCKCACESEFGCLWVSYAPAPRDQSAGSASAQSVPGGLVRVSVPAPPSGPRRCTLQPCLPSSPSLAASLALSLLARSVSTGLCRRGRGGGAREGGGEAPAFLRSGRNLSQRYWSPEEPSCSPGAPPGLLLPARACRDGHGLGLELGAGQGSAPTPAPGRLPRPGTGRSAGAGREGFPNPG